MKSPYDGASRGPLRIAIALVLSIDTLALAVSVSTTHKSAISHPFAPGFLLALGGKPHIVAPIALAGLLALALFARRPSAIAPGFAALACNFVLCEAQAALLVGPMRVFFTGGAVLLGWLSGLVVAKMIAAHTRERAHESSSSARAEALAEAGATGALAATYVNAITSKLLASGLSWADADGMRALVITQRGIGGHSPLDAYAHAVITSPSLAWTLSSLTLLIQAAAIAYPWSPRLRAVIGTLLLAFHLNVWLLTPIFFPQAMLLLIALSYPWPRIVARARGRAAPKEPLPNEAPRHAVFAASIGWSAVIAGAVLIAMALPIRRYTSLHHHREPNAPHDSHLASPPVASDVRALLGDLREGALIEGLVVKAVRGPREGAIAVELAQGEVAITIEIVKHGQRPFAPPAQSERYDVFYGKIRPNEGAMSPARRDRMLAAIAEMLRSTEEKAPSPSGM